MYADINADSLSVSVKSHNEKSNNPLSHNQLKCTKLRSVAAGKEHYGHLFLALFCAFFFRLFFCCCCCFCCLMFFFLYFALLLQPPMVEVRHCGCAPASSSPSNYYNYKWTIPRFGFLNSSASADIGSGVPQTNTPVVALKPVFFFFFISLFKFSFVRPGVRLHFSNWAFRFSDYWLLALCPRPICNCCPVLLSRAHRIDLKWFRPRLAWRSLPERSRQIYE